MIDYMKKVNTEYFVNEEKRTIACVVTTIDDVRSRLEKYGLSSDEYDEDSLEIREYTGIAKCSPEDTWDETYGCHLAEYRAQKLRQIDVNNEIRKYIRGISKCIDNLYDYGLMKNPHKPTEE